jgi:large subunit ribosomal protein L29|tara:strand:+ start:124 stop:327 length:204 start_codon:yes stop_codon:yes gene_type:complete
MAKKKNIQDMALEELKKELIDVADAMLNLRFQKSLQQLEDPLLVSQSKKNIARIKTYIRQYELGLKK